MVSNWLELTVEYQLVTQKVLGLAVGRCLGFLYAYNGMVLLQDTEWIQGELNVIIGLFRRYKLVANVAKSKTMTCQMRTLWSGMWKEVVGQRCMSRGEM